MCGICGVVGIEKREISEPLVRSMLAAIVHRGPDEEALLAAPPVVAGSRRLSIIDLPGGSQPVWNENKTLAVVFNGEIYNFRELRKELESAGHRFKSHCDTEAVVQAYEAWGQDCLQRLRGMFAFAIIAMPQGPAGRPAKVFLARDRLGIKPLYYALVDGVCFFASEVRALIASGSIALSLSAEAIQSYLLFGSVGEPMTLVDGICSLPPGHFITVPVDQSLQSIRPQPYWDIGAALSHRASESRSSFGSPGGPPASQVRSLLEDAVRSHLVADVPIGVFLSGGLDSTAIAALASRAQSGIHTLTVSFPDIEFSEAAVARRTAERLGTDHRELTISGSEMVARLDEAIDAFDQPSMDGVNSYFVSWAARQAGLKVALSGLGSDELFGGYTSFAAAGIARRLAKLAWFFPRGFRQLAAQGIESASHSFGPSPDYFRKALAAWRDPQSFEHPYFFTRTLFTPHAISSQLREDQTMWNQTPWGRWLSEAAQQSKSMDEFTAISWLELRSYLASTLLRDTDAMSMRHSLEVRVPFLDTPLVEYVLSLPGSTKDVARSKGLLVAALGDLLPEEIITQKKRTFTFPWKNWLNGALGNRVAGGLRDWSPALEPYVSGQFADRVWRDFCRGRTSWSRPWSLFVLNEWIKRNLRPDLSHGKDC